MHVFLPNKCSKYSLKLNFSIIIFFFLFTAISMIVACVAFPFGFNSDEFRKICGPEANRFEVGLCSVRWAYVLAIIGMNFKLEF